MSDSSSNGYCESRGALIEELGFCEKDARTDKEIDLDPGHRNPVRDIEVERARRVVERINVRAGRAWPVEQQGMRHGNDQSRVMRRRDDLEAPHERQLRCQGEYSAELERGTASTRVCPARRALLEKLREAGGLVKIPQRGLVARVDEELEPFCFLLLVARNRRRVLRLAMDERGNERERHDDRSAREARAAWRSHSTPTACHPSRTVCSSTLPAP